MVMLGLGPLDVQFQRKRTQHDAGLVLKGIVLGVIDILQAIQQGLPGKILFQSGNSRARADPGPG